VLRPEFAHPTKIRIGLANLPNPALALLAFAQREK
jgi:hypothetical protein